jgi:transposase
MKSDGRKLDRSTQARVRRQVVRAVRKGMTQVEAAKVFGMSLRLCTRPARGRGTVDFAA